MRHFVITKYITSFYTHDLKGRKQEFPRRRYSGFIITVKGKIRFTHRDGELIAQAGHPVFLPRGLHYVNECLEDAESYVFNLQTLQPHEPMQLAPVSDDLAAEIYKRIREASLTPSLHSELAIMEAMYALTQKLLLACDEPEAAHPAIEAGIRYMRQHCHRPDLTVCEIARHGNISEVYLRKLFARELGMSPSRKLTELRMQQAKLLIAEQRPLKEIAERVGYSDVFQFSRAFKRYFGYPPSQSP